MKASVKLRPQASDNPPAFHPLLRLKLPITILGLPFLSSASVGPFPSDAVVRLRTLLPRGPSLLLSYHPPSPLHDLPSASFSLTLTCGLGPLASPLSSPLSLSARLPLLPGSSPSFSLRISAHLGDFSLKRSLPLSPLPDPVAPKENGGGIHRPLPVGRIAPPWPAGGLPWTPVDSGVNVTTAVPVLERAAVTVRWGVRLPSDVGGGGNVGPPFIVVDKISLARVAAGGGRAKVAVEETVGKGTWPWIGKEAADDAVEKGAWWWIGKEAEEMRREQESIRRGIEEIRKSIAARKL